MKQLQVVVPAAAEAERVSFTAHLVATASHYVSDITIADERNDIDLKSVMGLMTIVISPGKVFTIVIDGSDEDFAAEAIANFFGGRGF